MIGLKYFPLCVMEISCWLGKVHEHWFLTVGNPRSLFNLFSSIQTNITFITTNTCDKMSIQCTMMGFEPTTFKT